MNRSDILEFQYLHSTTIDMHTNCTHVKITYQTTSELKIIIKNLKKNLSTSIQTKTKSKKHTKSYDYERMPFKGYNSAPSSGVYQSFMFYKYLVVVVVILRQFALLAIHELLSSKQQKTQCFAVNSTI